MTKRIDVTAPLDGADVPAVTIDAGDAEAGLLVNFLGSDLQGSLAGAREIIDQVDSVASGDALEWSQHGNSFLLKLKPDGAALLNYDAEDGELDFATFPLADFRQAVADWLLALERIAGGAR